MLLPSLQGFKSSNNHDLTLCLVCPFLHTHTHTHTVASDFAAPPSSPILCLPLSLSSLRSLCTWSTVADGRLRKNVVKQTVWHPLHGLGIEEGLALHTA